MATKPDKVELYEQGIRKVVLTDSDSSLNGQKDPTTGKVYNGDATSVKIFGGKDSGVTFYDDKEFKVGENSVYIEKLTDEPIEVNLKENFFEPGKKLGNGMFVGEKPEKGYKWVLFKAVKLNRFQVLKKSIVDAIPLDFEVLLGMAKESPVTIIQFAGNVAGILDSASKGESDNFRVDNCSSVQFGG